MSPRLWSMSHREPVGIQDRTILSALTLPYLVLSVACGKRKDIIPQCWDAYRGDELISDTSCHDSTKKDPHCVSDLTHRTGPRPREYVVVRKRLKPSALAN